MFIFYQNIPASVIIIRGNDFIIPYLNSLFIIRERPVLAIKGFSQNSTKYVKAASKINFVCQHVSYKLIFST
jgi:hypothetical protein